MAEFTKERIIEELKASTQNASGMFEISEDTICNLMSMLTNAAPQLPHPAVGDGRDQFEEWFKFHHGDEHSIVKLHRANGGANYRDPHVDLAWIAWKDSRAAMLQGAEPVSQPLMFTANNISQGDAEEILAVIEELNHSGEPSKMVAVNSPFIPDGWDPCSPEWIERNGPCSCAEAPRIAFGSIGNHYHPHIYHNPKHEETP